VLVAERPSYDPATMPPTGGDASRYALGVTPGGFAASGGVAGNVAAIYGNLLAARIAEAKAAPPPMQDVVLKAVVVRDGSYDLADRGSVSRPMELESKRPSKRWRKLAGGAFLDSFFLGADAFQSGPDLEVFEAALALSEQLKAKGRSLRSINDSVAVLCCLRAGLSVSADQLPHPPV